MSARCSGNVWKHSQHKGSELLVLLAIADYAKDDGSGAWPSVALLAEKTRLSERNVQYVLRKLEESGELVIERNAGPHGCHLYNVAVGGEKFASVEGAKIAPAKFAGGANQRTGGVQTSAKRGAIAIAPYPSIEPSIEPSIKRDAPAAHPTPLQTSYPDTFEVTEEMRAKVRAKYPDLDIDEATEEWAGAMCSNRRKYRYTDWQQAWYGAMRRANEWGTSAKGSKTNGQPTSNKAAAAALRNFERIAARRAQRSVGDVDNDYLLDEGPGRA